MGKGNGGEKFDEAVVGVLTNHHQITCRLEVDFNVIALSLKN